LWKKNLLLMMGPMNQATKRDVCSHNLAGKRMRIMRIETINVTVDHKSEG
jgi:hypothetical protein